MAGLIEQGMPAPAGPAQPTGNTQLSPKAIEAQLHLDPQQKQQLQRIVAAGMKVMFDQQSHQMMLDSMQAPGPVPDKLGQGIAGLLGLLMQESKNSLPPQLLVPAGLVLIAHAAEFMNETGMPVSDEDFGNAVDVMVTTVLDAFGLDAERVAAVAGDAQAAAGGDGQPGAAPPAAPTAGGM